MKNEKVDWLLVNWIIINSNACNSRIITRVLSRLLSIVYVSADQFILHNHDVPENWNAGVALNMLNG